MKKKKRVLSLVLSYKIGGTAINSLRFIKNSQHIYEHYSIAHRVDTENDLKLRKEYDEFTTKSFDVDTTRFKIASLIAIVKIAYKVKPHIVHVSGKGGALYGFFLRLFYWRKFKLFHTMRGFHIKFKGLKNSLYLGFEFIFNYMVTKAIAVSPSEREFYLAKTKASSRRTIVIPNGIEVNPKVPDEEIQGKMGDYRFNIVSLSRTDAIKDLETMLGAFNTISDNAGLHIMGGYVMDSQDHIKYQRKIRNLLETLECKNRVHFWGDVSHAGDLIHNFDIYWSTSLSEGLPTAIVEAMMSKVLVVGTDCRGNVDLIKDMETGILTKMKDPANCADGLEKALTLLKEKKESAIITKAHEFSNRFSIANHVKSLVHLYNS